MWGRSQAWRGLIDCLEQAGAARVAALPECLLRAAEIAEGKGNFLKARALRVRLGTVLDSLGKQEEALEAVSYTCYVCIVDTGGAMIEKACV